MKNIFEDNLLSKVCWEFVSAPKNNKFVIIENQKLNNWNEITKHFKLDMTGEQLRLKFKNYRTKNGKVVQKSQAPKNVETPKPEKVTINSDDSQVHEKIIKVESAEQLKDANFLMKEHGYDPSKFELIFAQSSIWNVFSNQEGMQNLYSSKIKVKPLTQSFSVDEFESLFNRAITKYKPIVYTGEGTQKGKYTWEIPIFDVHYGKVTWIDETGENYDHKITANRLWDVIHDQCTKINTSNIKKIYFPIGNDFFNASTIDGTTINGTRQDNDLRWQKMFEKGSMLLVQVLNKLSKIAPVEVFYVPGNHDKTISYYTLMFLRAWFRESKHVYIDKSIKTRAYKSFGNNLIGYSHGNLEKKRINTLMQSEVPKLWGNSVFREWHLGHLHSEQTTIEQGGLILRKISSICGTDAWHYENGYTGAIKKLQTFLWDDDEGLINIVNSTVKV